MRAECACVCVCVFMFVCVHVCVCMCVCVCVCVYSMMGNPVALASQDQDGTFASALLVDLVSHMSTFPLAERP